MPLWGIMMQTLVAAQQQTQQRPDTLLKCQVVSLPCNATTKALCWLLLMLTGHLCQHCVHVKNQELGVCICSVIYPYRLVLEKTTAPN